MALVSCRECGSDVSDGAKNCPHCGIKNPAPTRNCFAVLLATLSVIGTIVLMTCSGKPTAAGKDAAQFSAEDAQWLKLHGSDPKALEAKFGHQAQSACAEGADDFLKSIAKYEFKWDDFIVKYSANKFDQFSFESAGSGMLTLVSTRAKLSNGFGAFEKREFYCLYDVARDAVIRYSLADPAFDIQTSAPDAPTTAIQQAPVQVYTPDGGENPAQEASQPENAFSNENAVTNQTSDQPVTDRPFA